MTTTRQPSGLIRGLTELVQAIPYLLGFRPAESLVVIALDDRSHVVVTMRIDLGDVRLGGPSTLADTVAKACAAGAVAFVAAVFTAADDRSALPLRLVSDDEPPRPSGEPTLSGDGSPWERDALLLDRPTVLDSSSRLAGFDVACTLDDAIVLCDAVLLDVVLVRDGRWWSYVCDQQCCPRAGRLLPDAPSAFVATATVAGTVVAPDRASLAALLDPCPAEEQAAQGGFVAAAENDARTVMSAGGRQRHVRAAKRALFAAARASHAPGWQPPPPAELARYAVALTSIEVRDSYLYGIEDRTLDGRPLLCEIARRCPPPYDVAALFLFGWASWRAGNGMLADLAATRALESDPDDHAARTLHLAVSNGLDPGSIPRLRRPPQVPPGRAPPGRRPPPMTLSGPPSKLSWLPGGRRQSATACGETGRGSSDSPVSA